MTYVHARNLPDVFAAFAGRRVRRRRRTLGRRTPVAHMTMFDVVASSQRRAPGALSGRILVATAGEPFAEAVLRTAAVLAAQWEAAIEILVVSREKRYWGGVAPELEPTALGSLTDSHALRKLADSLLSDRRWRLEVGAGEPAPAIASRAADLRSPLIVMGHGEHDTVIRTIRAATCPVLTVPVGWNALPTRVLAALDFSLPSVWAAEVAARMTDPNGLLELLHVGVASHISSQFGAWADEQFARVRALLDIRPAVVSGVYRTSDQVVESILTRARGLGVDLIAVGSSGVGVLRRLLVGSVATRVVRGAPCAVLAAPPPPVGESDRLAAAMHARVQHRNESEWRAALDAFSARNAGRQAWLETVDPEHGAFGQEEGYILSGATYDERTRRVSVMLGVRGAARRHVTRSIGAVESIDIASDASGREIALSVWHGEGVTELRLGDGLG